MITNNQKLIIGNCLDVLRDMEGDSIDLCITSPPYWNLRDYNSPPINWGDGYINQLGLEPSPDQYINHLMLIFDEVKRVLKPSGACFVNIGDTYDNKSLCSIPSKFELNMINRGWLLRNEIIWHKLNVKPTSAKDRFTIDHEKFYFFTKKSKYYFKQQREPLKESSIKRAKYGFNSEKFNISAKGATTLKVDKMSSRFCSKEGRNKRTVWSTPVSNENYTHCAMFPKTLIETPIKACCPPGGIVLDPFCGSGTLLDYCFENNIKAIGIEINPDYKETIEKRARSNQSLLEIYTGALE